jgi:hypothetical protein
MNFSRRASASLDLANPWIDAARSDLRTEVAVEPAIVVRPRRLAGIPELADRLPRRELTGDAGTDVDLIISWIAALHPRNGPSDARGS